MGHPVVHFEIQSNQQPEIQKFYETVLGWSVDNNHEMGYGIVNTNAEGGIGGGIGGTNGGPNRVTFYVGTDDVQATLDKAVSLGGQIVMPPMTIPGQDMTIGMFADPEGNVIGLSSGM